MVVKSPRQRGMRRGWFAADTMIGLFVVLVLIATLGTAVARQQRASTRLAEARASLRLAEQVLTALQTGDAPPAVPAGTTMTITPLDTPAGEKLRWVRVDVVRGGRSQMLVGVVPVKNLKG